MTLLTSLPDPVLGRVAANLLSPSLRLRANEPLSVDDRDLTPESVQNFVRFASTCRTIRATAGYWVRSIRLSKARTLAVVRLCSGYVREIEAKTVAIPEEFSGNVIPHFPVLRSLLLSGCHNAESLVIAMLRDTRVPNLTSLSVECSRAITVRPVAGTLLQAIAEHGHAIRRLSLQAIRYAPARIVEQLLKARGSSLEHLRLGPPLHSSQSDSTRLCSIVQQNCPRLSSLELYLWSSDDGDDVGALVSLLCSAQQGLEHVSMATCLLQEHEWESVFEAIRLVKHLSLSTCRMEADHLVNCVRKHRFPEMNHVELSGFHNLRDCHVEEICDTLRGVQRLELAYCDLLTQESVHVATTLHASTLRELRVLNKKTGNSAAVRAVARHGHNVERLDLSLVTQLSADDLRSLLDRVGKGLRELTIHAHPTCVSDVDIYNALALVSEACAGATIRRVHLHLPRRRPGLFARVQEAADWLLGASEAKAVERASRAMPYAVIKTRQIECWGDRV